MNAARSRTPLKHYLALVFAGGAGALVYSLTQLPAAPNRLEWLLFAALGVVTGSFTMKVAAVSATITVSDTFFIASTLLFGPAPPTVALGLASAIVSWRRGHSFDRLAFNTCAPSLSMWLAGQTFFLLAGVPPLALAHAPSATLLVPLLCLTAVYFMFNSGLTAVAIGLDERRSPLLVWRTHFLWLTVNYLAAGSVALCMILLIQEVSFTATAMVLPLLVVFHLTLRSSFGRLEDARSHLATMDRLYLSTVETLAMAIDAKDDVTHSHVRRVQTYAVGLARALKVTDEPTLKAIEAAALLHDTGKLAIPEHILNKPGRLTAPEFEKMKQHVDIGADILSLVEFPYPVVPIVRCHHENWDGSGYPRGIAGTQIPIGARILSVVDCFDALTSDRPYRRALSNEDALAILRERRGSMYDPLAVDTFIEIHESLIVKATAPEERDVLERIAHARQQEHPAVRARDDRSEGDDVASTDLLAFASLARLAAGDVTLPDVLALASNLIRGVLPSVTAVWYILDEQGALEVLDASGPAADQFRGLRIALGDRLTGWVAANRQPMMNSDPALDLGPGAGALRSCLAVPLLAGDTVVGVLSCYAEGAQAFTDKERGLADLIAPHAGRAIGAAARRQVGEPTRDTPRAARELRLISAR